MKMNESIKEREKQIQELIEQNTMLARNQLLSDQEFIEALDIIEGLVVQSCAIDDKGGHVSELDSMGLWNYADALHYLAKHSRVIILKDSGKRVIAKLGKK